MPDSTHPSSPFYFGLSNKDRLFAILVAVLILIAIGFLVSDSQRLTFDVDQTLKSVLPTLSLAVLSALVLACIYAYLLFQNTSFLFVSLCWLANLVYTIFSSVETTEIQMYTTYVVALTADVPLFLSGFNEKQRRVWLPLLPLAVIVSSMAYYNLPSPPNAETAPSVKLLVLYIIGPLASTAILFWTAYALYFRNVLSDSIKHPGAYSLTFLLLGLLQIPFTFKSLCHFMPLLPLCAQTGSILIVTKTLALLTKVTNLFIVFFIIKDGLMGLKSAEQKLKIKGEFEELGFFAASIEHELRNPLEVVEGEIEFLKARTQTNEELQGRFSNLERQLSRISVAADIINVLRSKRADILRKMKPVSPLHHLNQAVKYVKKEMSQHISNIFFTVREHTKELSIEAYGPLLEQCLVNLFKNSVESISRSRKSGEIEIDLFLADKSVVAVSVRDNGDGFIPDDFPKLTDPGYTQKPVSTAKSNRGLGLFVCEKKCEPSRRADLIFKPSRRWCRCYSEICSIYN